MTKQRIKQLFLSGKTLEFEYAGDTYRYFKSKHPISLGSVAKYLGNDLYDYQGSLDRITINAVSIYTFFFNKMFKVRIPYDDMKNLHEVVETNAARV